MKIHYQSCIPQWFLSSEGGRKVMQCSPCWVCTLGTELGQVSAPTSVIRWKSLSFCLCLCRNTDGRSESWMSQFLRNCVEALEIWFYKSMLRTLWTGKKRNMDILKKVNSQREVFAQIRRGQFIFFGHLSRREKTKLCHDKKGEKRCMQWQEGRKLKYVMKRREKTEVCHDKKNVSSKEGFREEERRC